MSRAPKCVQFFFRLALGALALALMTLQIYDIHGQEDFSFISVALPHLIFFYANASLLSAFLMKWTKSSDVNLRIWCVLYCVALVLDLILLQCYSSYIHSPATSDTIANFLTTQLKLKSPTDGHSLTAFGTLLVFTSVCKRLSSSEERASRGPTSPPAQPDEPPPRYADIVDVKGFNNHPSWYQIGLLRLI